MMREKGSMDGNVNILCFDTVGLDGSRRHLKAPVSGERACC
jgi:hypothetical protein